MGVALQGNGEKGDHQWVSLRKEKRTRVPTTERCSSKKREKEYPPVGGVLKQKRKKDDTLSCGMCDGDALRQVMSADGPGSHQGVELWKLDGKGRFISGDWDAICFGL
jgi:hypothetical protein